MPDLTGLTPYLVGYEYEINIAHSITFKGGSGGGTTLRIIAPQDATQYYIRETPQFSSGRPSKLHLAGVEGHPFYVNIDSATATEGLELMLYYIYSPAWL